MIILDGKNYSKKLKNEIKDEVAKLIKQTSVKPGLAIVLVGENPASCIYVRNKMKAAAFCNIVANLIKVEENITQEELVKLVNELNNNEAYHGIIVQLPLPKHIDEQVIIDAIDEKKDVDGFGIMNKGKLFSGLPCIKSATPKGIIKLLEEYQIDLTGKNAVVVGRSNIVGKPMAMMLLEKNATVTICHSRTRNLPEITKNADILVSAIGRPEFVTADMVKDGAVVIDVGINRTAEGKLKGDVDFENVSKKASYITPVPGGVGPMTIAMLMNNVVKASKNQAKK